MKPDLLNRVRWANVGRAAAVLAAAVLVVAWPRLRGAPPALPPSTPALAAPTAPALVQQPDPASPGAAHRVRRHRSTPARHRPRRAHLPRRARRARHGTRNPPRTPAAPRPAVAAHLAPPLPPDPAAEFAP
jgi:hypothetical protein